MKTCLKFVKKFAGGVILGSHFNNQFVVTTAYEASVEMLK